MSDKKLKIEINADAEKARRAARGVGEAAAEGLAGAADSAERLSASLEKTAAAARRIDAGQLVRAAGAMAGMLAGVAEKAAEARYGADSAPARAAGYASAALGGATAGAQLGKFFGPAGAVAGALAGGGLSAAGKYFADDAAARAAAEAEEKLNAANRETLAVMLEAERRTAEFRRTLEGLADASRPAAGRLDAVGREISAREAAAETLRGSLAASSAEGSGEAARRDFARQMRDYAANRAELDRLEALRRSLGGEEGAAAPAGAPRDPAAAAGALERLGGWLGGGGEGLGGLERTGREQLAVLRSIERKTGLNGGSTWQ